MFNNRKEKNPFYILGGAFFKEKKICFSVSEFKCLRPSFCTVELSKRSPSLMRNRNLILCKEFAFFLCGPLRWKLATAFSCSCRGWNWNFFSQRWSCRRGTSLSLCILRGAAWHWLGLTWHGFPFSKWKPTSLDKAKNRMPSHFAVSYQGTAGIQPSKKKKNPSLKFFFQVWEIVFKVCLHFKLSFPKNEKSVWESR